jgi:hypothetical protein
MDKYFQCKKGCTQCCPQPGRNIGQLVTFGDAYRAFFSRFDEHLPFSTVCKEEFEIHAVNFDMILKSQSKSKSNSNESDSHRYSDSPYLYTLSFVAKNPCRNLTDHGCKAHGTINQYIACAAQPQISLLSGMDDPNILKSKFPCLAGEEKVNDNDKDFFYALNEICIFELGISLKNLPHIGVTGHEGAGMIPLRQLTGWEETENIFWEIMKLYDDPYKMFPYYDEIVAASQRYHELIESRKSKV